MSSLPGGVELLRDQPVSRGRGISFWLWPQLLSLDVIAIFVAWFLLFSLEFRSAISGFALIIGGACVWCIYVGDHLLDLRRAPQVCTLRHQFVARHRSVLSKLVVALVACSVLAAAWLPTALLVAGTTIAAVVVVYLAAVHFGGAVVKRWWPKELIISIVFAAGTSFPTWSSGRVNSCGLAAIVGFTALCVLNCTGLEYRESATSGEPQPQRLTAWIGMRAPRFGLVLAVIAGVLALASARALFASIAVSAMAVSLILLGHVCEDDDSLRALVDAAMLTPLLVLPFLS